MDFVPGQIDLDTNSDLFISQIIKSDLGRLIPELVTLALYMTYH